MNCLIKIVVFVSLINALLAAPPSKGVHDETGKVESQLLKYESHPTSNGHKFLYETTDGQFREETLTIVNKGTDDEYISIVGSYSYFDTNNKKVLVSYTADKNGYVAKVSES